MISKILDYFKNQRLRNKETTMEVFCTVISCWLIAVGVCIIVGSHLAFQIDIVTVLWQTFLAVIAAFLLTRRWWIIVIYFGILVPVFFLAISLSGDIYGFFASVAGFVKWWASSMPYNSRWYSNQGFYMVHFFTNIGITVLFFIVSRITKRPSAVVILAIAFVAVNYSKGFTGYNVLAVPFLLVGIFPLVAGQKFQRLKFSANQNHFGVRGKKWFFVTVSTVMAILVSTASFVVVLAVNGSVRTRVCSDIVADIQTASDTFTKEQQTLGVTLFDLGLVTNTTYIGGSLYEIEPEVIATTDLTEKTLVKITSFDTFNGMNWTTDFKKGYRINGIWRDEQDAYLSSPIISNGDFIEEISSVAYAQRVNITLAKNTNFLPVLSQTFNFSENTPTNNPILFDELGRLVSYYGQEAGYSYTIDALTYETDQKVVRSQVKSVMEKFSNISDPLCNQKSEFYKRYTKSFTELPKELSKAVNKIKTKTNNPYDIAYRICEYFSKDNGYAYEKRVAEFKRGEDIVKRLAKTKEGHCLYYATAMVAMAREAGVPSRLAAGYVTVESEDGKTQVIDKSSPYAWVECYVNNIGWIAFNPSPIVEEVSKPDKNGTGDKDKNANVDEDIDKNTEKPTEPIKKPSTANLPLILGISVLAILVILLVLNTLLSYKAYELKSVRKRLKFTSKQAKFYYKDILRQFAWLGFRFKRGETIFELSQRACKNTDSLNIDIVKKGIAVIEEWKYGNVIPNDDDIALIFELRENLEQTLIIKDNAFMYAIKRRMLLPIL